jgi:hypothetical protein
LPADRKAVAMRVRLACVALLVVTAGCALGASPTETPTAPPATATPGECSVDLLITPDGNENLTPRALPGKPDGLSAERAGEFARRHEQNYAHNLELGDQVETIDVTLQGTTVKEVGAGYLVRIHVWTQRTVDEGGNATETDDDYYDAHYYVSDGVLRRAETDRHGTLPDRTLAQSGLTIACWG